MKISIRLLIVCSAVLLCLTDVAAQSGRRTKKTTVSVPTPVNPQEGETKEEPKRITSIIIVGHDIDPDMKEVWSNETSTAAKACTERLKEQPRFGLEIIYGGKLKKPEAFERAKKETTSYVLWFGYRSKLVGLDYVIDYIDYIVLLPQTAKTLTEGRVYPNKQKTTVDPGGIMRLPTRTRPVANKDLLRVGGQQIADRIKGVL